MEEESEVDWVALAAMAGLKASQAGVEEWAAESKEGAAV